MNEKKWKKFFELMRDIIDIPAPSWNEKKQAVMEASNQFDGEAPLDEFISWFDGEVRN